MANIQNLPAPKTWQRARLKYLLQYEPQRVKSLFQSDPEKLHNELKSKAQQAVQNKRFLLEKGKLSPDQISEILLNLVAPSDGIPAKPLPEDQEFQIRDWFESLN